MKRIAAFVLLLVTMGYAQNFSATCPYDGNSAGLERTVGFGANRVCWYGHSWFDPQLNKMKKHEFYTACPVE